MSMSVTWVGGCDCPLDAALALDAKVGCVVEKVWISAGGGFCLGGVGNCVTAYPHQFLKCTALWKPTMR